MGANTPSPFGYAIAPVLHCISHQASSLGALAVASIAFALAQKKPHSKNSEWGSHYKSTTHTSTVIGCGEGFKNKSTLPLGARLSLW